MHCTLSVGHSVRLSRPQLLIVYECHINFGADESTRQTWFVDNSGNGYRPTLQ